MVCFPLPWVSHFLCFSLIKPFSLPQFNKTSTVWKPRFTDPWLQPLQPSTEVPHARHWKQPKKVPSAWVPGKVPVQQPEKQPRLSKQLFFGCFNCSFGCVLAFLPWPPRHLFRLFSGLFQCRAFGTPEGPAIKKNSIPIDRVKFSIHALEIFNPCAWKFQSRLKISISLENFNPDLENCPRKGPYFQSRLKFSISIENFSLRLVA